MVNIGIVGVGGIAGAHLDGYSRIDTARIVALCDKIPERASGQKHESTLNIGAVGGGTALQVKSYLDYREFVNDPEVEVVDVCLPTDLHAEVSVAALEAGKHVLCEKPMALSVADCDRMIAAAEANGRFLMIAQCIRFWSEYLYMKEMVDSGKYGKVTSAIFRRLSGLPRWSTENWFTDPKRSGGAILDLHVHDADFITYLLGLPKSVQSGGVENENGIGEVMTRYNYDGGEAIYAEGGWYYPSTGFPFRSTFLVRMEEATIELDGGLTVYQDDKEPCKPEVAPADAYRNEIAYFLDCVTSGVKPTVVTPWDARETIRMVLAEAESVRTGKTITL